MECEKEENVVQGIGRMENKKGEAALSAMRKAGICPITGELVVEAWTQRGSARMTRLI